MFSVFFNNLGVEQVKAHFTPIFSLEGNDCTYSFWDDHLFYLIIDLAEKRIETFSTDGFVRRTIDTRARMAIFLPKYKPIHGSNTLLLMISCCCSSFAFSLRFRCWMFHLWNLIISVTWSSIYFEVMNHLYIPLLISAKARLVAFFFMKRRKYVPPVFNPCSFVT